MADRARVDSSRYVSPAHGGGQAYSGRNQGVVRVHPRTMPGQESRIQSTLPASQGRFTLRHQTDVEGPNDDI